jgi:hypothetical protein
VEEEDKVSAIEYALNLIAACHSKELLFTIATKMAEAFSGNDPVLEFLSERTVARLHEIEEQTTPRQPVHRLRVADA